ncbi:conserved virulence factor C family protein [Bacillus tuaregi]|uniref:conserved virulence factor C family protein n=1 Tax=Bacillus tuaregi TaxID=1816695 RepID=UPI0008F8B08E|nr:conserved virulence factor C family protein [Bacillus tuaregi]
MNIKSIEPTPSPNTMKVILDQELPMGKSNNYKKHQAEGAPSVIKDILEIDGIKGVYHVADFLAVERNAKFDWKEILQKLRQAFGEEVEKSTSQTAVTDEFGEIKVQVQMYKGIPIQVKLTNGQEEKRLGLPNPFVEAVNKVQLPGENYILGRIWKDYGNRYGDMEQVGNGMIEEILAAYPIDRLNTLVEIAVNPESQKENQLKLKRKVQLSDFAVEDWKERYRLLEQMEDPKIEDIPVLEKALQDEKASIRRLAVVYFGMIEDKLVLPYLYKALKDKSVTVRRTAGDTLSDLGYIEAMDAIMEALEDENKLVRWRAAMFLYEVGNERALPALKSAEHDSEFEVSLQIKLAIERIEQGEEAKGSVWKQMTDSRIDK